MKKLLVLLSMIIATVTLGCGAETDVYNAEVVEENNEYAEEQDEVDSSYSDDWSNDYSDSSSIEHYCEVSDCYKEGTYEIEGISGMTEYYCYTHYDEMQDIISYMEESVGSGSASKHTCESCSKEGTHSIEGISGMTEYYCTEHYNEMIEILEMLFGE